MIEELPSWVGGGGAGALLITTVWLIFTGRLIPRRHHDEVVQRYADELTQSRHDTQQAEQQRDDAIALAHTMTDMNVRLVAQKDASHAAVESVARFAAENAGGET